MININRDVPSLPWDRAAEEEKLFRRVFVVLLVLFLLMSTILPQIPVPEKQREQAEEIPPRLAKLVMEKQKPPPPPPPPEPEPEPEEPEPEPEPEKEPEPEPEKKKEEPKPTAKEQAKAAIAVFDDLADLRDTSDLESLNVEQKTTDAGAQASKTERSLIGTSAIGGSGGVSTSKASAGGGGSGTLAAASTTKVESSIEDAEKEVKKRSSGSGRRSTEDIQLVFDKNKGSIYSLYRRALRNNPTLEGTIVLRLEIQPDGSVTKCEVVSSELNDEDLERKIVLKVKRINFGAKDVEVWNDTYPISFIPS